MSPDSTSSLFPDRPIRPLPKRTIRQRLSPEVAKTIKYPPAPQNIPSLFAYPYNAKEDSGTLGSEPPSVASRENASQLGQEAALRRNGLSGEYHEESLVGQARRALISRPFQDSEGGAFRSPQRPQRPLQARHNAIQPPPSATSSADGYDSFENTNNKKKRKIPTAGETMNGTHVLNDSSALGMPSPPTTGDEGPGDSTAAVPTPYYQSGGASVSTQGISGPGRGRYGRTRNGRSPLRTLPDPNNAWNGRTPKLRGPGQCPSPPGGENSGIISNAIATAERLPAIQGQENISLLQQQASTKNKPTSSTQFTFTFDPQNPISWPGSDSASSHISGSSYLQHHSTSSPYRDLRSNPSSRAAPVSMGPQISTITEASTGMVPDAGRSKGAGTANVAPRKPKRRGNSLARAARERRQQTEYNNYLRPPNPEDFWLCEFCEYERIFGHPPMGMIRRYEIKDRNQRHEEANRKRLLDKAKAKSRKGKKSKAAAKGGNAATSRASAPPAEDHDAPEHVYLEDGEGDEYYQDDIVARPEYYDDAPGSLAYTGEPGWLSPRPNSATSTSDQAHGLATGARGSQVHAVASV